MKRLDILLPDMEWILRARRQRFDLTIHPAKSRLRKDHPRADTRGAVADDAFSFRYFDFDSSQRLFQRKRAQYVARQAVVCAVNIRDNPRLLDGGESLLGKHSLLKFLNAKAQR